MAALIALAWWLRAGALLNADTSWFLFATARWLAGGRLYVDIVEVNPPLAFFLTVPATAAARAFHLDTTIAFVAEVFILAFVSLALTGALLRAIPELSATTRRLFLLAALFVMLILPAKDFGEREHLTLMLALPYVALLGGRHAGARVPALPAIAAGLLGALGFGLKPHFLLVPALLEISLLLHRRRLAFLRPETLALAAGIACYLAVIVLYTPEYLEHVVPMALAVYERGFRRPLWLVCLQSAPVALLLLPAILLLPKKEVGKRALVWASWLAAIGFLAAFFWQMKGWDYQRLPSLAYAILALFTGLTGVETTSRATARSLRLASAALLTLIAFSAFHFAHYKKKVSMNMLKVQSLAEGKARSFASLSADLAANFPLVNARCLHYSSRFPALWLLPGALRAQDVLEKAPHSAEATRIDQREIQSILRYVRRSVVEDLRRHPPDIIAVDKRSRIYDFGTVHVDLLGFFLADPSFAEMWKNYRKVESLGRHDFYRRIGAMEGSEKRVTTCYHRGDETAVRGAPATPAGKRKEGR